MMSSYLLFLLAGVLFGVQLGGAVEIVPWREGRKVPLSYSYVEGLIEYRGTIYPIFNLTQRLGMKPQEAIGFIADSAPKPVHGQSIILLEDKQKTFGICADSVIKMAMIAELAPAPQKIRGLDPQYIKGIAFIDNQEVFILDFERLFFHAG
jgi:purine-binding chemotaxis protein CheW